MKFLNTGCYISCNVLCIGDEHKRSKKSLKRKKIAKDDNDDNENDAEENTDTIKHDTDSEQTNSTVCENIPSGTKQSNVEVVTFINPQKKNKLSKAVEPARKVRGTCSLRSTWSPCCHLCFISTPFCLVFFFEPNT